MIKIPVTVLVCVVMLVVWRRWLEPLVVAGATDRRGRRLHHDHVHRGRPRPDVPRLEGSPVDSSFPSGHTAAAVVYAAVVVVIFWHTRSRWIRVLAITVVTLVSIAVGVSRMQRGMHFLSDVVFGGLLGAATVIVVTAILTHADRTTRGVRRGSLRGHGLRSRAVDARVVGVEQPERVRLPQPDVQHVEGRQPEAVGCVDEHEVLAEQLGRLMLRPVLGEDDVLDRGQAELAVPALVEHGFGVEAVDLPVARSVPLA